MSSARGISSTLDRRQSSLLDLVEQPEICWDKAANERPSRAGSPDTTESTTLTWHSASRNLGDSGSSPVRILDVQRRARPHQSAQAGLETALEQCRNPSNLGPVSRPQAAPSTLAVQSPDRQAGRWPEQAQRSSRSSFKQQQSSADNLSASFDSDYDLLVYLGETETEDLVETERSLDYQDQTWRQSICGGASLAPTIDDSLGELLGGADRSASRLTIASRGSTRLSANLGDSLATPTADSPFFRSRSATGEVSPPQSGIRDRSHTLVAAEARAPNLQHLQATGSEWNIGNRRPMQAQQADELDRLLAEMSQSLDLDALAKFDTKPRPKAGLEESRPARRVEPSNESILDELDGASRMLDEMLSERRPAYSPPNRLLPIKLAEKSVKVPDLSGAAEPVPVQTRAAPQPPMQRPRRKSSSERRPPTPPAVDYDLSGPAPTEVIHMVACEPELSDLEPEEARRTVPDTTKRRAMTGKRSMRAKLSDFVSTFSSESPTQRSGKKSASSSRAPSRGSIAADAETGRSTMPAERSSRRDEPVRRSFGQQIRDRLSRSKTRFLNKFKRAQSSPNSKVISVEPEVRQEELFEPGDIARNSDDVAAVSRDSSLDRHLKADLERNRPKSGRSSESELSGLEISKTRPARPRRPRSTKRGRADSKESRPRSLLSLKRLSSLRLTNWRTGDSQNQRAASSDNDDELRRPRSGRESPPACSPVFGRVESQPVGGELLATVERAPGQRQAPSRSQSLRVAAPAPTGATRTRTITSSSGSLARRLPAPSNSFRPASVCALQGTEMEPEVPECTQSVLVTSVSPTGTRIESARPAQLDGGVHNSPLKAKGVALLGDLKQFFAPGSELPPPAPRRPPRRRSKSVAAKVAVAAQSSPTPLPPQGRLSTLANQIRHSAADFFHATGSKPAKAKAQAGPGRAPERDLCEWKPVVGRAVRPRKDSAPFIGLNLRQQRSLDTDSTWDSSGGDDDDDDDVGAADEQDQLAKLEGAAPVAAPTSPTAVCSDSSLTRSPATAPLGLSWSASQNDNNNNNKSNDKTQIQAKKEDHLQRVCGSPIGTASNQVQSSTKSDQLGAIATLERRSEVEPPSTTQEQPETMRSPRGMDEADLNLLKAISHKRQAPSSRAPERVKAEEATEEERKRLSVYENVSKPAAREPVNQTPPDSWSVGEPELASEPGAVASRLEQLLVRAQTTEEAPNKPRRQLHAMTSIIQEPNDELMAQASSVGPCEVDSSLASELVHEESSNSSSSSFAEAAANRRRLISRFETPPASKPARPKCPAFVEGRAASSAGGQSLVKRLARNFDQAAGAGQLAPEMASAELDEPRSESTWYDAKSVELLDEADLADLLHEFDDDKPAPGKPGADSEDDAATLDGEVTLNEGDAEDDNGLDEDDEAEFRSAADSTRPTTTPTTCDPSSDSKGAPVEPSDERAIAPSAATTSTTTNRSSPRSERRASKIDPKFKDSLNHIIANQTSQPGRPQAEPNGHATKKPRERCGLTRYYEALVRRRRKRSGKDRAERATVIEDFIHSSSSSSSSSASSSDNEDQDEQESERGKSGKSWRLYEELGRLLASRSRAEPDQEDEQSLKEVSRIGSLGYEADQVSLSSSSLSSESIPEIRQRQNLQKLYNIVNEIYSSEAKFVDTLKLLNVDFRTFVSAPQKDQTPIPIETCLNLGPLKHLPQLQALNENLLEELRLARDQWPRTQKIAHVLVKIGPFLKHYSTYIREFELMQQQLQDNMKKYPSFAERIRQFEASERSQKLSLQHHLLKPIQRIPQYRLLLQQYLHHLKPDDADYEDTVSALEVVSRVAEHANQSMSEGANFAKLLALQAKIVGRKRADLVRPGRVLVKEGELMKLCRKQDQPRYFVLLSDAILYLTQIQSSDILYLNNELPLDDCQVSTPTESKRTSMVGSQFDTEFHVRTKARSFALKAKDRQERDEWLAALRRAIEEHSDRRRSFQPARHSANASLLGSLPLANQSDLLGHKAPLWTPDSRVTMCQLCTSSFSALFRRHHCRACGRVVCSACSSNKAPLVYLKCRAARVCDQCYDSLKANIHLYYLPGDTLKSEVGEQELQRLDEHFRSLLKSQFVRHSRLMSSGNLKSAQKMVSGSELPSRQEANDSGASISGYLHRRHPRKPKWKRQWFVIKDKVLYTYRAIDDVAPMGSLPLLGYSVSQPESALDGLEPGCLLRLSHQSHYPTGRNDKHQQAGPVQARIGDFNSIEHLFKAESEVAAKRWLDILRRSVVLNDE